MALTVEKRDRIARVTLDRPPVNAITLDIYAEIGDVFESAAGWDDVNCIVFTGAGSRAFCAACADETPCHLRRYREHPRP